MSDGEVKGARAGESGAGTVPLWREEFPVEAVQERYVSRRQFLRFLTLTGLGMLVGNVVILARSLMRHRPAFPEKVIAASDEVPIGAVKLFSYPGENDPCILVHTADAGFTAFSQTCTHLSCPVYFEKASERLLCPCHRGAFSAIDGRVLYGPPERPLPRIRLEARDSRLVAVAVETGDER